MTEEKIKEINSLIDSINEEKEELEVQIVKRMRIFESIEKRRKTHNLHCVISINPSEKKFEERDCPFNWSLRGRYPSNSSNLEYSFISEKSLLKIKRILLSEIEQLKKSIEICEDEKRVLLEGIYEAERD